MGRSSTRELPRERHADVMVALDAALVEVERISDALRQALASNDPEPLKALDLSAAHAARERLVAAMGAFPTD